MPPNLVMCRQWVSVFAIYIVILIILDAHIEEHCKYYDAILIQVLGGNFNGKSLGASHDSFKPN